MTVVIAGLDPAAHKRHALHDGERRWPETNCYVDLWIEVLSALGHDPTAVMGFTVAQDFEGDQFTFFKTPAADLEKLYGVEVLELSIFDNLENHLANQIARRRLPLVEVDAFFLPDTRGVDYRTNHSKTTVGVNRLDPAERRLDYFHNAGFFTLDGEDYDGLFRGRDGGLPLFPYVEFIKFGVGRPSRDLAGDAVRLLRHHLARRPARNPLRAWNEAFDGQMTMLAAHPPTFFHAYAFNTLRQLGGNFDLLASHLDWLSGHGETGLAGPRDAAGKIAETAKTMQFKLARAVAKGQFAGLDTLVETMAAAYDDAIGGLVQRYAAPPAAVAA